MPDNLPTPAFTTPPVYIPRARPSVHSPRPSLAPPRHHTLHPPRIRTRTPAPTSMCSADKNPARENRSTDDAPRLDAPTPPNNVTDHAAQNPTIGDAQLSGKLRSLSSQTSATAHSPEEEGELVVQGPTQAPSQAGVSTVGLSDKDAAFFSACYDADVNAIEKALAEDQDVNVRDVNRRTALHFCAGNGLPTLCRSLLQMGAEINAQDVMGYTPLHMATGYRKLDTVKVLVDEGADANIASTNGDLPVEIAERVLAKTPAKRFFMANPEYGKLKDIVQVLDDATELEDDDEDEEGESESENGGENGKGQQVGSGTEITEETDNAKFVVRVKPKGETMTPPTPPPSVTDVKVTVRVKKPDS